MNDETNTYPAVYAAIAAVSDAIAQYYEARYANYRQRLVSPKAAYHHTCEDAERIVREMLPIQNLGFAALHQEELLS